MPLTKYAVDFDPAAPTLEDRIGSFLIGAGGTVITSTGSALDVNIASSSGLGIYAEDSASSSGQLIQGIGAVRQDTLATDTSADGDWSFVKTSALGEVYMKDSSANATLVSILADTATIDSQTLLLSTLVKAEDAAASDGGAGLAAFSRRQDTLVTDTSTDGDFSYLKSDIFGSLYTKSLVYSNVADDAVSSENPIFVGGYAMNMGSALSAVSAAGDKARFITDLYRQLFVSDVANVAWTVAAESVTTTAAQIVATPLAGRKKVLIQNQSGAKIWVKNDNTVAANNTSVEINPNNVMEFPWGESQDIWAIAGSGTRAIAVMEAA